MALRTESDIIDAVGGRERDSQVIALRKRYEEDYEKWRLTSYQLGKKGEYENYTSNAPRNLVDKTVEKLATAPLQIEIPIDKDTEEERTAKANAERFYYGVINLVNSRLEAVTLPSIQEQLAFYATLRGSFAIRAYMRTTKQRKVIPDVVIWDLLNTTWEVGSDNLLWVCHTRTICSILFSPRFYV